MHPTLITACLPYWPPSSCRFRQTPTQYFRLHKERLASREMTLIDNYKHNINQSNLLFIVPPSQYPKATPEERPKKKKKKHNRWPSNECANKGKIFQHGPKMTQVLPPKKEIFKDRLNPNRFYGSTSVPNGFCLGIIEQGVKEDKVRDLIHI